MSISSLQASRALGVGAVFLGVSAFMACGGSTTEPDDTDPRSDGGGGVVSDAGRVLDAAAPSDAGPTRDASNPEDAAVHADAGLVDAAVIDASSPVDASFAADYSAASNPNGVWSYGYSLGAPGGDAAALIVYPTTLSQAGEDCWYDENHVALGAPAACYNGAATTTATGIAPGAAALHPGENGEYSIARFTASVAGSYVVHVGFEAGDQGETNGMLVHGNQVLWSVDATSTNPIDDRTVTLAAGDTLDVAVGNAGNYLFDTTPTTFTVHSAP